MPDETDEHWSVGGSMTSAKPESEDEKNRSRILHLEQELFSSRQENKSLYRKLMGINDPTPKACAQCQDEVRRLNDSLNEKVDELHRTKLAFRTACTERDDLARYIYRNKEEVHG